MKKGIIGVGVVIAIYLAMCAFGSSEVRVERKLQMNHSAHEIYQEIVSFRNWQNWSPWLQMDPNIELSYEGTEGVGSSSSWVSNHEKVGNGSQTMVEVIPDEYILIDLIFDGQGGAQADFKINALTDHSSSVTWGFLMKTPFLARGFMMFIDFDTELGTMYETGLNSLNAHLSAK